MSLLVGVRHSDLHDVSPLDLLVLANVHSAPLGQREHCLRTASNDGDSGNEAALSACQAFIMEEIALALGEADELDLGRTENVATFLTFQGSVSIALSSYAFHMGRALHALQDSFSHRCV